MVIYRDARGKIDFSRVLMTYNEKKKWEMRYIRYSEYLDSLPNEIKEQRKDELLKIKKQIEYYDSILREMKSDFLYPSIGSMIRSILLKKQ